MAPRVLAAGTMLSGRYQLAETIGESDLSTVYAAADQRGHAQIALKVFDQSVMGRVAALSEYQSQARQASGLGVEGIARAYDFGIDANNGVPFSTAERINWASLDRRVLLHGPLGVAELSRALGVLARALDAAHAARLLHRDLKPQNVFISPDNPEWVRITDFGVHAVRRGAPEALGWGGPPGYTPPEAVDASAPGTPGSDLYALGVIAFFALTRGSPFRSLRSPGFDPNTHWAELNQPLYPISERAKEMGVALDPAFDAWFARALAVAPHDRFRSAGEMARELAALADQASARGSGGPRTMPGIAAAIAQPLVFQPEPSPSSLGLATTTPAAPSPMAAMEAAARARQAAVAPPPAPAAAAATMLSADEHAAGVPTKSPMLPLLLGFGVLLLGGLAYAAYAVLGKTSAPTAPSAAASVAPVPSASAAPAASAAWNAPARARFTCKPQDCEWVVCDGKNISAVHDEIELTPGSHDCSASRNGFGSKAVTFTATPGQVAAVEFELPPLPAATQQKALGATPAPAAKPSAATPAAKPASATPATKPPASKPTPTKPKKKCSTFLGCK
ncbi:MAG TPA: protein kinase [Polyangiaceae bacterium]|nr:protein kinase [Polyangiaceae bacterium]